MSPRRNRPKRGGRPDPDDEGRPLAPDIVVGGPAGWTVRAVSSQRAVKTYTCPDCNRTIAPGTAHVVAWRTGDDEGRRHWHRPCWERWARAAR